MCIFPLLSNPHRAALSLSYSRQTNNNSIYETVSIFLSCYPDTLRLLQPSSPLTVDKLEDKPVQSGIFKLNLLETSVTKIWVFFLCFRILTELHFHSHILGRKITIELLKGFHFPHVTPILSGSYVVPSTPLTINELGDKPVQSNFSKL